MADVDRVPGTAGSNGAHARHDDEEAFRAQTRRARSTGPDPADGEPPETTPPDRQRVPPGHDDAGEVGPRQEASNGVPAGRERRPPEPEPEPELQPEPEPVLPEDAHAELREAIEAARERFPHLDIPDLGAPLPGEYGPPSPHAPIDPQTVCMAPGPPMWEALPPPPEPLPPSPQADLPEAFEDAVLGPIGDALSILNPTSWTVSWSLPPDHPTTAEMSVTTPWQPDGTHDVSWSFGNGEGGSASGSATVNPGRLLAFALGRAPLVGDGGLIEGIDVGASGGAEMTMPGFGGRLGIAEIGVGVDSGVDLATGEDVVTLGLSVSARADDLAAAGLTGIGGVLAAIPPTFKLGLGAMLLGNRIDRAGERVDDAVGMVSFGLTWEAEIRVDRGDGTRPPTVTATLGGQQAPLLADAFAAELDGPLLPHVPSEVSLAARIGLEAADHVLDAQGLPTLTEVARALPEEVGEAFEGFDRDLVAAGETADAVGDVVAHLPVPQIPFGEEMQGAMETGARIGAFLGAAGGSFVERAGDAAEDILADGRPDEVVDSLVDLLPAWIPGLPREPQPPLVPTP